MIHMLAGKIAHGNLWREAPGAGLSERRRQGLKQSLPVHVKEQQVTHINIRRDIGMGNGGSDWWAVAPISLPLGGLRVAFPLRPIVFLTVVVVVCGLFSLVV